MRAARPSSAIVARAMDTAHAVAALRRGEMALALLRLDRDRHPVRLRSLGREVLAAALPAAHPLAAGDAPLDLAALADEPMLVLPRAISPAYSDAMVAACRALAGPIHAGGAALAWHAERQGAATRLARDLAEALFPASASSPADKPAPMR